MGALERKRGSLYEREVCAALSEHLGGVVKRQLGQARDGGADIRLGRVVIECKRRRSLKVVYEWLQQAMDAAAPGQLPAVVFRADGEESMVLVRLADFIALAREEML